MKTRSLAILVSSTFLCVLVVTSSVRAQPVTIVGGHSCAEYLRASNKDRIYPQVWTLGYLSGWAFTTRIDGLKDLNNERVGEFLLDYCDSNRARPQLGIASAADMLRFILEKRAKGEPLTK